MDSSSDSDVVEGGALPFSVANVVFPTLPDNVSVAVAALQGLSSLHVLATMLTLLTTFLQTELLTLRTTEKVMRPLL